MQIASTVSGLSPLASMRMDAKQATLEPLVSRLQ